MTARRIFVWTALVWMLFGPPAFAAETVTVVYQNDLHGWLFPTAGHPGMEAMARVLEGIFEKEPSSLYAMSGDLFMGPDFPEAWRGKAETTLWNAFCIRMKEGGYGDRILLSCGNHEFDYGLQAPDTFVSGLLCANLLTSEGTPFYAPHRVITTPEGLRIGVVGLLLEGNGSVQKAIEPHGLRVEPMLVAVKKSLSALGPMDLTVLMIHERMEAILALLEALPVDLGVDLVLSGHDHVVLDPPLVKNGVTVLQAGAMARYYGVAELLVDSGRIQTLKNRMVPLTLDPLEKAQQKIEGLVAAQRGEEIARVTQTLDGLFQTRTDTAMGNFVTDAFRWATGSDLAMTNRGSLRMDFTVNPGDARDLTQGDLRTILPFKDPLRVGKVTGRQLLEILEGEAGDLQNHVSGVHYVVDPSRPKGRRLVTAEINGKAVDPGGLYKMTHNAYAVEDRRMEKFLHMAPGLIRWEETRWTDRKAVEAFARHLRVISYATGGEGRIRFLAP